MLPYLLDRLRRVVKVLYALDAFVTAQEVERNAKLDNQYRLKEPNTGWPTTQGRGALDVLIADATTSATLVSRYQALLSGIPLPFVGVDRYSTLMNDNPKKVLAGFLKSSTHCATSIEALLRGEDDDDEDSDITDQQVFDTYRAIGCQTFTEWEISVHREVNAVWLVVEQVATEKGLDVDRILKARMKKARKVDAV